MPSHPPSTHSEFDAHFNVRSLVSKGETDLWLSAMEIAFLRPHAHVKSKTRNTLLRA
jgi:hypothetical protein